jgi:hypothetical protein
MNSRIGSARTVQRNGALKNSLERSFDFLLNAAVLGLPLPTMKMSAQVLND